MNALALWLTLALGCSISEAPSRPDDRPDQWWTGASGWCGEALAPADIDAGIALGRRFLLANQYPEGNFVYEYDWKQAAIRPGDNQVRQSGATWGLSLVHQADPTPETRAALLRSIAFWRAHEVTPAGLRMPYYPNDRDGHLGTLALVALAHIEFLRTEPDAPEAPELRAALDGYLATILSLRMPDGRLHERVMGPNARGIGPSSPYSDGEALLALVKAARYLGRDDLWPAIEAIAEGGYVHNVRAALDADPDSDTTKGYYQWTSMSWYELLGSGRPGVERWGDRLVDLAIWMIDTHRTLQRTRNTAYAYEGIVPAYAVAKARNDPRAEKLGCVVQLGMRKLASWQLGHPLANPYVAAAPAQDPRAEGGIQNEAADPVLRIDVVQHQTHAMLLTRRLWAP